MEPERDSQAKMLALRGLVPYPIFCPAALSCGSVASDLGRLRMARMILQRVVVQFEIPARCSG
jgi:hypothetical protein